MLRCQRGCRWFESSHPLHLGEKMRDKTRRERYEQKKLQAKSYPISIATVNFMHDGNLGYLIRSVACFGAQCVHVIGSVPDRSILNPPSGGLFDYVKIIQHSSPTEFVAYARNNDHEVVSAEISNEAESIHSYRFNFRRNNILVVGQEETGIPIEILQNSTKVLIPMPGVGFCLNTSQTANIMLYEAVKQLENQNKFLEDWMDGCYIHLP